MYQPRRQAEFTAEPHGMVQLKWQDDLMIISTQGPFNVEGIKQAGLAIRDSVTKQGLNSWIRMDITDDNALGDPEVISLIGRNYQWGFDNGCRAMALIYCNSLQKVLCEEFLSQSPLNIKLFFCVQEAEEWLKTQ